HLLCRSAFSTYLLCRHPPLPSFLLPPLCTSLFPYTTLFRSFLPILVSAVAIALIVLVLALRSGEDTSPTTFEETASTSDSGEDSGEAPTAVDNPDEPDLTVVERRDPDDPLAAGPVDAPDTLA